MGMSACYGRVKTADLPGRYRAEYQFGEETLTLRPDGTFSQIFLIREGPKIGSNLGRWAYDSKDRMLDLQTFRVVSDGYCHRTSEDFVGGSSVSVEREFFLVGRIRLGPDEGCPLLATR